MRVLRTTRTVLNELGGNIPVARMLRTDPKAVSNWRSFNRFPAHTYLAIKEALERKGCTAPDYLWPMTKPVFSRETADNAAA